MVDFLHGPIGLHAVNHVVVVNRHVLVRVLNPRHRFLNLKQFLPILHWVEKIALEISPKSNLVTTKNVVVDQIHFILFLIGHDKIEHQRN